MKTYEAFRQELQRALDIGTNLLAHYRGGAGAFQRRVGDQIETVEVMDREDAIEVATRFAYEHVFLRGARVW